MQTELSQTQSSFALSSGPGSPIFDQNGPHARIRRAPVRAIGAMQVKGREIYGQVVDISSGGCLFRTESTLAIGDTFSLRVTILDGGRRVVAVVHGEIRGVRTTESDRPSYGCAFVADTSEERRAQKWLYAQAIR